MRTVSGQIRFIVNITGFFRTSMVKATGELPEFSGDYTKT